MSIQDRLDRIVKRERERAKAAEQLCEIFRKFPGLLREVVDALDDGPPEPDATTVPGPFLSTDAQEHELPRPTEAIIRFLEQHGPATITEIGNALCGQIATNSPRPRAVISSTVHSLAKRGRLKHSGERYSITNGEG